ncbi:MAG: glycogen/starch synthase, partial [Bacteroidales bacterium]|nr:glycogen/starch synthase [Bacteroidales bacterium]
MEKFDHLNADYVFEVSWEVCNKVGGIHTVLSTKSPFMQREYGDNFILIGPDVWKETHEHPEFLEDLNLFRLWKEKALLNGLNFRIGRWNIPGRPVAILVDFTTFFPSKDEIFAELWEYYQLDSLSGQWDYIEPSLFGYGAGKVIENFYDFHFSSREKIIAHFHEWMTGAGVLYLEKYVPQVGTVFTTHATILGRSIAANGLPLYDSMDKIDPESAARSHGITAKYSLERCSAQEADCFVTVSDITAKECEKLLGKAPDIVTPNGFDESIVPEPEEMISKRQKA